MAKLEKLMTLSFVTRVFVIICGLLQLSSTPSAFAQLTRLKTSYSALTANMAAYWLAKDAKIFEKHGLSVDVVLIESGVTTVQALTAGETQIAMGGGTVAVSSGLAGGRPDFHRQHREPFSLCAGGAQRDQECGATQR